MIELLIFLLVTTAIVVWWQLMQGRQKARAAAGRVCANHGLQLLDDTVSLFSITWNRSAPGKGLTVSYGFEFATNGALRRRGVASLGINGALTVTLDLDEGRLIENLTE